MTRKELTADIKKRVAAGESKRAIFSRYSMTELVFHRLMLPCTTFFFTAKKTAMGQPVFED